MHGGADTMSGARRAVGYIRVSTAAQAEDGLSLDAQRQRIEASALLDGVELVEVIVDAGVSGGKRLAEREGGARLCELVASGGVDVVVVAKLDRLGRSAVDLLSTVERWQSRGVGLRALDLGLDTSGPMGRMVLGMMSVFAEFERAQIGERTRVALAEAKRQGAQLGSEAFGWTRDPERTDTHGRQVVKAVEHEVEAVRRIVSLRDSGMTWRAVAAILEGEGVPTKRGGRWQPTTVRNIYRRTVA